MVRARIFNFTPGLDQGSGKSLLPLGGVWRASNFHPYRIGLEKRRGYSLASANQFAFSAPDTVGSLLDSYAASSIFPSSPVSSTFFDEGNNPGVRGVRVRKQPDSNSNVLVAHSNHLINHTFDGEAWTAQDMGILFTAPPRDIVQFADFGPDTIIASSGRNMKKFDGTTIADLGGTPPKAGAMATFEGFIIAGDLNPDSFTGENYHNGIRWSGQQQPEVWDDNADFTAGLKIVSQCMSQIQAIAPLRDELIILHKSEVQAQRFIGGAEIFRTRVLSTDVGCLGRLTYYAALDSLFWLGYDNIYVYAGDRVAPLELERRVTDEIFSLRPSVLQTARFNYDRLRADLWIFFKTSPPRAYVINLHYNNWARFDYQPEDLTKSYPFAFFDSYPTDYRTFFVGEDSNLYSFAREEKTDRGLSIKASAEIITDFEDPGDKQLHQVTVIADGQGTINISAAGLNNPNATPLYSGSQTLIVSTLANEIPYANFSGITGRYFALKLETIDDIKIREITLHFDLSGVGKR